MSFDVSWIEFIDLMSDIGGIFVVLLFVGGVVSDFGFLEMVIGGIIVGGCF